jgi:lipopolysaccharide transport system permease protein
MDTTQQQDNWTEVIKPHSSIFSLNLKEVWQYRDLLVLLVRRDFVTFFKQTILGPLWFFISPVFTTIIFTFVFGNIAQISTDGAPQVAFYLAGVTLWNYFSGSLTATAGVFTANASIFGKVYFPRLIMPLSIVVSKLMQFAVQYGLFIVVVLYYYLQGAIQPNWWIMATPLIIILMAAFSLGLGMIFSSLTTKYKDLTQLLSFGVQLFMYATPVIFPISAMPDKLKPLVALNPLTGIFECFKYGYLGVGDFTSNMLWYSAIVIAVILALGTIIFNKVEKSFMDTV